MDLDQIAAAVVAHTGAWPQYPYPEGQWVDILWTVPEIGELMNATPIDEHVELMATIVAHLNGLIAEYLAAMDGAA